MKDRQTLLIDMKIALNECVEGYFCVIEIWLLREIGAR